MSKGLLEYLMLSASLRAKRVKTEYLRGFYDGRVSAFKFMINLEKNKGMQDFTSYPVSHQNEVRK